MGTPRRPARTLHNAGARAAGICHAAHALHSAATDGYTRQQPPPTAPGNHPPHHARLMSSRGVFVIFMQLIFRPGFPTPSDPYTHIRLQCEARGSYPHQRHRVAIFATKVQHLFAMIIIIIIKGRCFTFLYVARGLRRRVFHPPGVAAAI